MDHFRRSRRSRSQMGPRSSSIQVRALLLPEADDVVIGDAAPGDLPERPKTRGDCVDGYRPCPWAGCKHHLLLDVNPETGSIKLNFGHIDTDQLGDSCALDVADSGAKTLDDVGGLLNVTRERIRQLEMNALNELKRFGWRLR